MGFFPVSRKPVSLRLTFAAVLWLALPALMFAVQTASEAPTVAVDKSFHNREIKIKSGGLIRVSLEELGAAGYQWKIQGLDENHFEVADEQVDSKPSPDGITGAPVVKTWKVRAKEPGRSELRFVHYRPWEDETKASDRFVLKVRILP